MECYLLGPALDLFNIIYSNNLKCNSFQDWNGSGQVYSINAELLHTTSSLQQVCLLNSVHYIVVITYPWFLNVSLAVSATKSNLLIVSLAPWGYICFSHGLTWDYRLSSDICVKGEWTRTILSNLKFLDVSDKWLCSVIVILLFSVRGKNILIISISRGFGFINISNVVDIITSDSLN